MTLHKRNLDINHHQHINMGFLFQFLIRTFTSFPCELCTFTYVDYIITHTALLGKENLPQRLHVVNDGCTR